MTNLQQKTMQTFCLHCPYIYRPKTYVFGSETNAQIFFWLNSAVCGLTFFLVTPILKDVGNQFPISKGVELVQCLWLLLLKVCSYFHKIEEDNFVAQWCTVNFILILYFEIVRFRRKVLVFHITCCSKVHFWEGHIILRNLPLTFDWHYIGQK